MNDQEAKMRGITQYYLHVVETTKKLINNSHVGIPTSLQLRVTMR